jgi:hypothetical protein
MSTSIVRAALVPVDDEIFDVTTNAGGRQGSRLDRALRLLHRGVDATPTSAALPAAREADPADHQITRGSPAPRYRADVIVLNSGRR